MCEYGPVDNAMAEALGSRLMTTLSYFYALFDVLKHLFRLQRHGLSLMNP